MQQRSRFESRRYPSTIANVAIVASVATGLGACTMETASESNDIQEDALITDTFNNASGRVKTVSATNNTSRANPFFQSLGTNGRSCVDCHQPAAAWGITPVQIQRVFERTNGTDPLFRTNDGSNAPNLPVGTVAERRAAYSMLLNHGLIRVGLPIPANAEFDLTFV